MTMAGGTGTANNASVVAVDNVISDDADKDLVDKLAGEADARVASAMAKVDQQKAHLKGAEDALATAIAERKAL